MNRMLTCAVVAAAIACKSEAIQLTWYSDANPALDLTTSQGIQGGPDSTYNFSDLMSWRIQLYGSTTGVTLPTSFVYSSGAWNPANGGAHYISGAVVSANNGDVRFDNPNQTPGANPYMAFYEVGYQIEALGLGKASSIYSVIWNNADWSKATAYAIIDDNPFLIPTYGETDIEVPYNAGNVLKGMKGQGGDWVAVPEPASLALFGLGLVTVAIRRAIKR